MDPAALPPASPPVRHDTVVWLIDDTDAHHQVAEDTAALVGACVVEHYYSGAEGLEAYAQRIADRATLPDVVLMDFFLGDDHGDAVTRRLRALDPVHHRPVIVGYSSVASASAAIIAAGGDVAVRKVIGDGINPHLAEYLRRWRHA